MILVLEPPIVAQLEEAVRKGGKREVGGILMGEHVGMDTFAVRDVTIQLVGGSFAAFVRLVEGLMGPLRSFFQATNHQYTRFNYLGEWHSHHSFALTPSGRDHRTMLNIVEAPDVGAHFVVLLLVKLDDRGQLDCAATVYRGGSVPEDGEIVFPNASTVL